MKKHKKKPASSESGPTEAAEKIMEDFTGKAKEGPVDEESLEDRLRAAEGKAEENYDRFLRVTAEFENYKKRMKREMDDFRKYANESLIKDILPIVDNLERALENPYENNDKTSQAMLEGVQMTLKGLLGNLEKFGVVPIESLNKPFDPNFHQSVTQGTSEEHPENTVLQELQKGYMISDRLLRPAMVVVSKKPDSKPEVESEDEYKINVTI